MPLREVDKQEIKLGLKVIALVLLALIYVVFVPAHAHHYLLLLVSILLLVSGAGPLLKYREQSGWLKLSAEVLSAKELIAEASIGNTGQYMKYYYPEIEYEYHHDGRQYRSTRVAFERENIWIPEMNAWGNPATEKDRWWLKIKQGDVVDAFINPRDPSSSVLVNSASSRRWSHHMALTVAGVLLAATWLWLRYVLLSLDKV